MVLYCTVLYCTEQYFTVLHCSDSSQSGELFTGQRVERGNLAKLVLLDTWIHGYIDTFIHGYMGTRIHE